MTRQMIATAVAVIGIGAGTPAMTDLRGAPDPGLSERLLQPAELPGFGSVFCPTVVEDAQRWAGRYSSSASLRRNGFVSGLSQPLYSVSFRAQGVTAVAQFASESGARAEVSRELRAARRTGTLVAFRVPDAPGGYGFTIQRGSVIERDVIFRIGRYVSFTGVTYRLGRSTDVSVARVADAAGTLYQRLVAE